MRTRAVNKYYDTVQHAFKKCKNVPQLQDVSAHYTSTWATISMFAEKRKNDNQVCHENKIHHAVCQPGIVVIY